MVIFHSCVSLPEGIINLVHLVTGVTTHLQKVGGWDCQITIFKPNKSYKYIHINHQRSWVMLINFFNSNR